MKVSIITVCFNSESFILDAIRSVNSQSYSHIEHIFIDGASQDRTVDIIRSNAVRNIQVLCEPDLGIYDAMNKGLRLSSGDIICFLNSDDFYTDQEVIAQVVKSFSESSTNLLWGDLNYVFPYETSKVFRSIRSSLLERGDLLLGVVPPHPAFFLKRSMLEAMSLSFDLKYSLAADFDFMKRAILNENFHGKHISKTLVQMRHGGVTSNGVKNIVRQNWEIIQSLKESFENFSVIRFIIYKIFKRLFEVIGTRIRYGRRGR